MEVKHIDYPLSTKYRSEWSSWEAVREIVQNALDSEADVNMEFDDKTLQVSDSGEGFEMKQLLIGETTKDGEKTIGKFGEGLKFALLVLLREDCEVVIRSNGIILHPKLTKIFDTDCLRINYASADEKYPGTEVTIQGIKQSYREKFLSLNQKENFQSQLLLDLPTQLFVKGIYVQKINSVSGYNLVVERENPITGSVDMDRVRGALYSMILNTDNLGYIETLLETVKEDPSNKGSFIEFDVGAWNTWDMRNSGLWKKASDRILGPKCCLLTSQMTATQAVHHGFSPIKCEAHFLKGFLPTDADVIRDSKTDAKTVFALEELPFEERQNLREVFWIMKKSYLNIDNLIKKLRIVDLEDNVLGCSSYEGRFDISYKVLKPLNKLMDVIFHEYVHFAYGCTDLTDTFVNYLSQTQIHVIMHLKRQEYKPPSKDFLKGTSLEYKSE